MDYDDIIFHHPILNNKLFIVIFNLQAEYYSGLFSYYQYINYFT